MAASRRAPPPTPPRVTDIAKMMRQPLGASMVGLGALASTGVVAVPSLVDALGAALPPHRQKHVAANRECLERGAAWVTVGFPSFPYSSGR
jgi:Pyruvate/2-oxoacid:ferredoxin oxidoreductase gamma subunit